MTGNYPIPATQNQKDFMIKRKLFTLLLIAATVSNSFAAGNGMAGILSLIHI